MRLLALAFAISLIAVPALAQPPADAMPLSQILASIEAEADFGHFNDIEWDSDGYWEIEFHRADGAKVEIEIDPVTGRPR